MNKNQNNSLENLASKFHINYFKSQAQAWFFVILKLTILSL